MSSAVVANFDAMQALRILLKLEEAPDQDSSYLRHLVLADAKRNVFAPAAEPASGEASTDAEAIDAAPEEAAVETGANDESAPEEEGAGDVATDSAAAEEDAEASETKSPPKTASAKA